MNDIVINATISTVGPLSIRVPVAEGSIANRFQNFPVMTRGITPEGQPLPTGYLPATTLRGFMRRAIVTASMTKAAEDGKHYTLQRAYAELIGQDAESEKSEGVDLLKQRQIREGNPVLDLFGSGLGIKSRLLVSHFMPSVNVLPEAVSGVRKDLEDTEGVIDLLVESDRDAYFGRNEANSRRAAAAVVVKQIENKLKKAKKEKADTAELDVALAAAKVTEERYESQMGEMTNSSRTVLTYYALPAALKLTGKLIIQNARDRDLEMIELALNALSLRPLLGAQVARGCGEIKGTFDVMKGGALLKKVTIGGWAPAVVTVFDALNMAKVA